MKSPSSESHVPLKTQTDRAKRLSGKSLLTTGPPEASGSSGNRSPWYCQDTWTTMPTDSGSISSSPTSVSSFSANSPVLPTPCDFDNCAAGVVNWEPSWLPNQTEQYSAATLSTDVASIPVFDQGCISPSYSGYWMRLRQSKRKSSRKPQLAGGKGPEWCWMARRRNNLLL